MTSPTPDQLRATRAATGLTQAAAAELVHTTGRVWRQWEAGDRAMHPAFYELFQLKTRTASIAKVSRPSETP